MLKAGLSFTLPPGFCPYNFAKILTLGFLNMFFIYTIGVFPIMFWILCRIYGAIPLLIYIWGLWKTLEYGGTD